MMRAMFVVADRPPGSMSPIAAGWYSARGAARMTGQIRSRAITPAMRIAASKRAMASVVAGRIGRTLAVAAQHDRRRDGPAVVLAVEARQQHGVARGEM